MSFFRNSRRQEIIKSNVLDVINESNYWRAGGRPGARVNTHHLHAIINHNVRAK